jgi:hypothetical protein
LVVGENPRAQNPTEILPRLFGGTPERRYGFGRVVAELVKN